jgi:hypothetical protein
VHAGSPNLVDFGDLVGTEPRDMCGLDVSIEDRLRAPFVKGCCVSGGKQPGARQRIAAIFARFTAVVEIGASG